MQFNAILLAALSGLALVNAQAVDGALDQHSKRDAEAAEAANFNDNFSKKYCGTTCPTGQICLSADRRECSGAPGVCTAPRFSCTPLNLKVARDLNSKPLNGADGQILNFGRAHGCAEDETFVPTAPGEDGTPQGSCVHYKRDAEAQTPSSSASTAAAKSTNSALKPKPKPRLPLFNRCPPGESWIPPPAIARREAMVCLPTQKCNFPTGHCRAIAIARRDAAPEPEPAPAPAPAPEAQPEAEPEADALPEPLSTTLGSLDLNKINGCDTCGAGQICAPPPLIARREAMACNMAGGRACPTPKGHCITLNQEPTKTTKLEARDEDDFEAELEARDIAAEDSLSDLVARDVSDILEADALAARDAEEAASYSDLVARDVSDLLESDALAARDAEDAASYSDLVARDVSDVLESDALAARDAEYAASYSDLVARDVSDALEADALAARDAEEAASYSDLVARDVSDALEADADALAARDAYLDAELAARDAFADEEGEVVVKRSEPSSQLASLLTELHAAAKRDVAAAATAEYNDLVARGEEEAEDAAEEEMLQQMSN